MAGLRDRLLQLKQQRENEDAQRTRHENWQLAMTDLFDNIEVWLRPYAADGLLHYRRSGHAIHISVGITAIAIQRDHVPFMISVARSFSSGVPTSALVSYQDDGTFAIFMADWPPGNAVLNSENFETMLTALL